jgi:hypothetical protein
VDVKFDEDGKVETNIPITEYKIMSWLNNDD